MTDQKLVSLITKLIALAAFGLYLFAVISLGQISLGHPNFVEARGADGAVIMENGAPKMIPNEQPIVPETISIIQTTIGAALALNFGAVIGISVTQAQAGSGGTKPLILDPNMMREYLISHIEVSPDGVIDITPDSLRELYKEPTPNPTISFFKQVAKGIGATLDNIVDGVNSLHPRYWAVVVYLIALVVGVGFYIADGAFSSNPGTIAADLKNLFLFAIGVGGGVLSNLQKS